MPEAPFHHQYYFYPKAGDLILFPSFLVHEVPDQEADSGEEDERDGDGAEDELEGRIAWPFNLYGDLEAWSRSNV